MLTLSGARARMLAAAFLVALTTVLGMPLAASAHPGHPGEPDNPATVFSENFENIIGGWTALTNYTSASGATYTATPYWLWIEGCNGFVSWDPDGGNVGTGCSFYDYTPLGIALVDRYLPTAGGNPPSTSNHALSWYSSDPDASHPVSPGDALLQSSSIPVTAGRYLVFQIDAAGTNCQGSGGGPLLSPRLVEGVTETPLFTSDIDPCGLPTETAAGQFGSLKVGRFLGQSAVLWPSSSLGITIRNNRDGTVPGNYNDGGIDNLVLLDATPQFDVEFGPQVAAGDSTTITLTMTNTSDGLDKDGWGFSVPLPSGVTVAGAVTNTCGTPAAIDAPVGGGTIVAPTGGLITADTCHVTVPITSSTEGTYPLPASSVTLTGLKPPADTSVTFSSADSAPPVISGPADMTVDATGASGAPASWTISATDDVDGSVPVTCNPTSGSTFAFGPTLVTCTATDAASNTATHTFTVTVADTTAPNLNPIVGLTREATGPDGAVVTWTLNATDAVDGTIPAVCNPPSGQTYPLGETTVSCTATDSHGNTASTTFLLTVTDTTAPTLSLGPNLTVEATGSTGAPVNWNATATDLVDGAVAPTCDHTSGETYPLGLTTVSCSATDAHGNTASGSFTVTVVDSTGPAITVADVQAIATGPSGAVVTWTATATDTVDGTVTPVCDHASGDTYPLGPTTVSCTATDAVGNSTTQTFVVTVSDPTAPVIVAPNVVAEATGPAGATVAWSASAADGVDGPVPVTCDHDAGVAYPMGTTAVVCTASDTAGNVTTATFTVSVVDTTAPAISAADVTVAATSADGATASWTVSATDIVDGSVATTCNRSEGETFPIGTSWVTCSATDAAGNTASRTFAIVVTDYADPVDPVDPVIDPVDPVDPVEPEDPIEPADPVIDPEELIEELADILPTIEDVDAGDATAASGARDRGSAFSGEHASQTVFTGKVPTIWSVVKDPEKMASAVAMGLVWTLGLVVATSALEKAVGARIDDWSEFLTAHLPRGKSLTRMFGVMVSANWPMIIGLMLLNAVILACVDPNFGFDWLSLRSLGSITAAQVLTVIVPLLIAGRVARSRWDDELTFITSPWGLVIGMVGVTVSRMIGFLPGLIGGSTMEVEQKEQSEARKVKVFRLVSLLTLGFGFLCLAGASVVPDDGRWEFLFLHDMFAVGAIMAILGTFVDLIPVSIFGGAALWKYQRLSWCAMMAVAAVAFALVVLPDPSYWLYMGDRARWWMQVSTGIIVATLALVWLVVKLETSEKRREAMAKVRRFARVRR